MGCSPREMEAKIVANMVDRTGRPLEDWIDELDRDGPDDPTARLAWLKDVHGLGHGTAKVVIKRRDHGATYEDPGALVDALYVGHESLRPLHDATITALVEASAGAEPEVCSTYVGVRANRQFAVVSPRADGLLVGLAVPDEIASEIGSAGRIGPIRINSSIRIESTDELSDRADLFAVAARHGG